MRFIIYRNDGKKRSEPQITQITLTKKYSHLRYTRYPSLKILSCLFTCFWGLFISASLVFAEDFFSVNAAKYLSKPPKDTIGVWGYHDPKHPKGKPTVFEPCIEVTVSTKENTRSDQTIAKVYFFDNKSTLLASQQKPSNAGPGRANSHSAMPVLFHKDKPERLFFEVPEEIRGQDWRVVIVFGDKYEAKSACYPQTVTDLTLNYPEKVLVYDRTRKRVERKAALDPLIQEVVKTTNKRVPQITLFLRAPKGVSDPSEVEGVMAICVLAGSVESIKQDLTKEEMPGDYNGLFAFANKHKLAILAWGASGLWNPGINNEDLSKEGLKKSEDLFDTAADAWDKGVQELCDQYGIPDHDFLLWGMCGSAQWAHRLCLRKPDRFLAIDFHIPGSFDVPSPKANKVLWCLTTGERYGGYQRSLRFVQECRKLGYPMLYKAVIGLGHGNSRLSTVLGFQFFEFALTMKQQRDDYDAKTKDVFGKLLPSGTNSLTNSSSASIVSPQPWPEIFRHPPYYGDIINQEMFPADQVNMIPAGYRTPIPTKELADIWALKK